MDRMVSQAVKEAVVVNIIIFLIFSYIGATFEHLVYYFSKKETKVLANPIITGFPIYGLGAFAAVATDRLLNPLTKNFLVHFLAYGTVLSLLELVAGLLVGAGPKARSSNNQIVSWDYSDQVLNYRGIISLPAFIKWGVLGSLVVPAYNFLDRKLTCGFERC